MLLPSVPAWYLVLHAFGKLSLVLVKSVYYRTICWEEPASVYSKVTKWIRLMHSFISYLTSLQTIFQPFLVSALQQGPEESLVC